MRLGYSDINISTGPGIFIKIKKVNGELINIGSCLRTPCNAVADHQGATDPWLKTPDLEHLFAEKLQLVKITKKMQCFQTIHLPLDHIPEVFNGIQVWRLGWS